MHTQEDENEDKFLVKTTETFKKIETFLEDSIRESSKYHACQKSDPHESTIILGGSVVGGAAGAIVGMETVALLPPIVKPVGGPLVVASVILGAVKGGALAQASIDRHHDACVEEAKELIREQQGDVQAEAKKAEEMTYDLCRLSDQQQDKITSDLTKIGLATGLVGPTLVSLPQMAIPSAIAGALVGAQVAKNLINNNQVECLEKSKAAAQETLDEHVQKTSSEEQQRIESAKTEAALAKALSSATSITGRELQAPAAAMVPQYLSAPPAPPPAVRPAPSPVQMSPSYNSSSRRVGFKIGFRF